MGTSSFQINVENIPTVIQEVEKRSNILQKIYSQKYLEHWEKGKI